MEIVTCLPHVLSNAEHFKMLSVASRFSFVFGEGVWECEKVDGWNVRCARGREEGLVEDGGEKLGKRDGFCGGVKVLEVDAGRGLWRGVGCCGEGGGV